MVKRVRQKETHQLGENIRSERSVQRNREETIYSSIIHKLIDSLSSPGTKSELDLFTVPPTQVVVKRNFWTELHLQNPCTTDGPWTFRLPKDMYYVQLNKNFLYIKFKITRHDGTPLVHNAVDAAQNDNVTPINLIGKTFIKHCKVFINGRLVSDSGDKYAYRSYIETELNHGHDSKRSQLSAALYEEDTPTLINTIQNVGWRTRKDRFLNSRWVETMAPLHVDLFQQDRYLLNNCELSIDLYRNSDDFCLMSFGQDPRYKIEVQQMVWYVKRAEVSDSVTMAIEGMLKTTTAKYPMRRTQMSVMNVTETRRTTPLNSLFTGTLPRRIVVCMVRSNASRGSYGHSPFNFEHFNLEDIRITSGPVVLPCTPYKLNFENGLVLRAFTQLFEGIGIGGDDRGNEINLEAFKNGSAFFVFELTADGTDSGHWQLQNEGTNSLDIQFGDALPAGGVDVIIYSEWDSLLMLDSNRQVLTDYSL